MVANDSSRIVASMPAFEFGPKASGKFDFAKSKQIARWSTFWLFSHTKVKINRVLCIKRIPVPGDLDLKQIYWPLTEVDEPAERTNFCSKMTTQNGGRENKPFFFEDLPWTVIFWTSFEVKNSDGWWHERLCTQQWKYNWRPKIDFWPRTFNGSVQQLRRAMKFTGKLDGDGIGMLNKSGFLLMNKWIFVNSSGNKKAGED